MSRATKKAFIIGLIGVSILAMLIAFFVAVMGTVQWAFSRHPIYKETVEIAQTDERISLWLGEPITTGYITSGEIAGGTGDGTANLSIPLKGSRTTATAHVSGVNRTGSWEITRLVITLKDKKTKVVLIE